MKVSGKLITVFAALNGIYVFGIMNQKNSSFDRMFRRICDPDFGPYAVLLSGVVESDQKILPACWRMKGNTLVFEQRKSGSKILLAADAKIMVSAYCIAGDVKLFRTGGDPGKAL